MIATACQGCGSPHLWSDTDRGAFCWDCDAKAGRPGAGEEEAPKRPAYRDEYATVYVGKAESVLRGFPPESIDALVTDPPAGISFMGASWDTFPTRKRPAGFAFSDGRAHPALAGGQEHSPRGRAAFIDFLIGIMTECRRVMRPGALGLVWSIPRTAHWTAWALEEAGFEIHPNGFIAHHFATGFPKAKTHLKPATEVWWLVRKPGRGPGLNIDECRIPTGDTYCRPCGSTAFGVMNDDGWQPQAQESKSHPAGRWPANLVFSHAEGCVPVGTRRVCSASGTRGSDSGNVMYGSGAGLNRPTTGQAIGYADPDGTEEVEAWQCVEGCPAAELDRQAGGAASRFYYVAKASPAERAGCKHPTMKSIALMAHLVKLVTPRGGVVLDPFAGSGSTLVAAKQLGLRSVGIEQDATWLPDIQRRLEWALREKDERRPASAPAAGQISLLDHLEAG